MSADLLLQELESTKASLRRAISDRDQLQTRVRELEHGRAASTSGDATAWVGELSSILALENLLRQKEAENISLRRRSPQGSGCAAHGSAAEPPELVFPPFEFHYDCGGEPRHVTSLEGLEGLAGKLTLSTRVWMPGLAEWMRLKEFKEICAPISTVAASFRTAVVPEPPATLFTELTGDREIFLSELEKIEGFSAQTKVWTGGLEDWVEYGQFQQRLSF